MYSIQLGASECPVFFEDKAGDRTYEFSLGELETIVNRLLDRKARKNGAGRYLLSSARYGGWFQYRFPRRAEPLGFKCRRTERNTYTVQLTGTFPFELLPRLNDRTNQLAALALTERLRAERRRLRELGEYVASKPNPQPRSLAGSNAQLKAHFQNSEITCADAIAVIAHAARLDRAWVRKRLVRLLDERSVGVVRLKGGFVFRVDLACPYRGLLSLLVPVKLSTTNDNTHGAYRRLRKALRKRLDHERKARAEESRRAVELRKSSRIFRNCAA